MTTQQAAWETWKEAGRTLARKARALKQSIVPLGEESFSYAASRGLPHQDIIRRAFREGYFEENMKENEVQS